MPPCGDCAPRADLTPSLPPAGQSGLFGDDMMLRVHSPKTGRQTDPYGTVLYAGASLAGWGAGGRRITTTVWSSIGRARREKVSTA